MTSAASSPAPNVTPGTLVRRTWRVPRIHGAGLIVPDWEQLPSLIERNRAQLDRAATVDVQGISLGDLRQQAQAAAKTLSRDYLAKTLRLSIPDWIDDAPLIVGGHQPELFHAGVWAKNFAVARLARRVGGVPLHLIVDQDTLNSHAIKVPVGTRSAPALTAVDFDAPHSRSPWETASVRDPALFASFAQRVTEAIKPWGVQPLIADQWSISVEQSRRTNNLVDALTALRAATERRWGAGTFELPLSHWWSHPAPLWFMAHLLAQHRRLLGLYNDVLKEYRVANRVRSRAHPVPDLVRQDDWYESPFWVWHNGDARRERLFVRQAAGHIELRDSVRTIGALPLDEHRSAADAVTELQKLSREGWRFRSRALTTTWAARMLLADVFIHGLGGAKYDEMTDALIGRIWGITPPEFATVSATVHLPLGEPWAEDHRSVGLKKHAWQDALHNPERHWDGGWPDAVLSLAAEKRRWLATADSVSPTLSKRQLRAENHRRDQRLRQIRQQLLQLADPVVQRLHRDYDDAVAHQAANRILQRREFSWVLFPEDPLRAVFNRLFPER